MLRSHHHHRRGLTLATIIALLVAACTGEDGGTAPPGSDTGGSGAAGVTVVVNADVYTVDEDQPRAEAFAYSGAGEILAVGTKEDVRAEVGDDTETIDAGGNLVLPGFQDPHVHVPEAGIIEGFCFLPESEPLGAYEQLAAACADDQAGDGWVRAAGPSLFDLRDADELPVDVLDRAIPDRPAIILDNLGHGVWTNSRGLEEAGIATDDPDPQGGIFDRDDESGRFTGLLFENAQHRVRDVAAPGGDTTYEGLLAALDELARNGITTISDAGGFWAQGHPDAWDRAVEEDTVTVRAFNTLYLYPDRDMDDQIDEFAERFDDDADDLVRFNAAKIYVDGILDLGTALLVDPYDQPIEPDLTNGFSYFEQDQLEAYAAALHDIGFQINFHTVGDGAVRAALDAVESIPTDDVADRHHRTTHNYMVHPDDFERFAELGVVADFQQGPDSTATEYHESLLPLIGDRAFDLIPTDDLVEAGALVTLSSDWDADPLPPFGTIARAVTRDAHRIADIETALRMMTLDVAESLRHDDETGSIEVGKQADYIIVDQDIFDIAVEDIGDTRVLLTALGGLEIYRSNGF